MSDTRIIYDLRVQNLTMRVKVPADTDVRRLDELVAKFNELIETYNQGKPVVLMQDQNTKMLIFCLLSFMMTSPGFAQPTPENVKKENPEDEHLVMRLEHLTQLCSNALKNHPL